MHLSCFHLKNLHSSMLFISGAKLESCYTISHHLRSIFNMPKPRKQMADIKRLQKHLNMLKIGTMSSGNMPVFD